MLIFCDGEDQIRTILEAIKKFADRFPDVEIRLRYYSDPKNPDFDGDREFVLLAPLKPIEGKKRVVKLLLASPALESGITPHWTYTLIFNSNTFKEVNFAGDLMAAKWCTFGSFLQRRWRGGRNNICVRVHFCNQGEWTEIKLFTATIDDVIHFAATDTLRLVHLMPTPRELGPAIQALQRAGILTEPEEGATPTFTPAGRHYSTLLHKARKADAKSLVGAGWLLASLSGGRALFVGD